MSWYTSLIRPLLFALDAETAHDLTMAALRLPGAPRLLGAAHQQRHQSLRHHVLGLDFDNPVGLGAGLDKQGTAVPAWEALGFGFVEVGTVTPRRQPGNPRPRLFRLPQDHAVVNRFGFNSEGAEAVARHLARSMGPPERGRDVRRGPPEGGRYVRLGINVGRNKDTPNEQAVDDYVAAIETLHPWADYFVVNVSSPNTAGLRALQDEASLRPLLEQCVAAARRASGRLIPVLVKVSPDMTDEELMRSVDAALAGGAVGVIATNTTIAREGVRSPATRIAEAGGLSGAPLRARANEACRVLFRHLGRRVPVVGVGGIASADHAYERIRSGATLVQVYTALIYEGPGLVRRIVDGLAERLARDGIASIGDAVGLDVR